MTLDINYDLLFEQKLNAELESIYNETIKFFQKNKVISNAENLDKYTQKLRLRANGLRELKPKDINHTYDHFIDELISLFPYKQHEDKYKSAPITNFFNYEFLEIKEKFIHAEYPYYFNEKLFNAKPEKIIDLMAKFFAIQDFILKASTVKILERDRPEKVAERIEKSRGVISNEKINQSEDISNIAAQQALIMHYLFASIPLDDNVFGTKATKSKIVNFLTGKNIDSIKDVLENHLGFKTKKSIKDDIDIIKLFLLKLQNKKIQELIMNDIKYLESEIHK